MNTKKIKTLSDEYIKDKDDFLKHYEDYFAERVFWQEKPNNKVAVKIILPFINEVLPTLNKIKN